MRPAPDLNDPEQLRRYRQKLRGVARGIRQLGVSLAVFGALLVLLRAGHFVTLPIWVPLAVLVAAFVLMAWGVSVRTRYHFRRMRGEDR